MLEFIQANWGNLLVGLVVLLICVGSVVKIVRDKRAGKGCAGCSAKGSCGCHEQGERHGSCGS